MRRSIEKEPESKTVSLHVGKVAVFGILGLLLVISLFSSIYTVKAGERAVLLTFGKPDMTPKTEGLHFKIPFVQEAVHIDVRTQKYEAKASAASKDLQTVSTEVTLNYFLTPERSAEVYKNIGVAYQDKVIQPAVQEVVKASTAQYTAEELITKRPEVKEKIDGGLRERLSKIGIVVQDVLITNFDFSSSFNAAIEAKVTAEQNALAAKNKLEQIKYEAEQTVTTAKGQAEAIKIQTEAINKQGGKDYVQLQAINKWNGQMPQFVGSGAVPFINLQPNEPTVENK